MTNTVNVPLLRKGLEWVEEQAALPVTRRRWNQGSYVVPWRRWLLSQVSAAEYHKAVFQSETGALFDCGTACCFAGYIAQEAEPGFNELSIEDQSQSARDVAIKHLGISEWEARHLFNGDIGPAAIRSICEKIAGEPL